jgi:methyltransferase
VSIRSTTPIHLIPLVLFGIMQVVRLWTMATLGQFWTTRIMTIANEPLVRAGPYRWMRHPNYAIVVGEVALLPLAFGQIWNAVLFSVANLAIVVWRIRVEDAALAPRAGLQPR